MIYIISILIILILVFITLFVISLKKHNKLFNHRFIKPKYVKYYTYQEFNLEENLVDIKCNKDTIKGFIYSGKLSDSSKIIIYTHGMNADHYAYMQDIGYLAQKYLVISFDILGTSKSSGKTLKCFSNATKSLDYVIKYVKENYKNKEIYLVGHSWGSYASLASLKYHNDIKGVVALSPFISRKNGVKDLLKTKILTPFISLIDYIKSGKYRNVNISKNLSRYKGRVLIVSSSDDNIINYNENTLYLLKKFKWINYIIENNKSHNPQYTISSVERLNTFLLNINKLSGDELIEYMKNTNYHSLGEIDSSVINKIIDFIKE